MLNLFFILVIFKIYRTFKSNNLSFDHNNLIKNPILFCKFVSSLKSHRNGFVFKICVWISVSRRKKPFKNPILGCRDICKINNAPFFFKHPVFFPKYRFNKIFISYFIQNIDSIKYSLAIFSRKID